MAAVALEDQGLYTFFCDEQLHLNITQSRSGKNMMERVVFDGENQVKFCLKVTQDPAVSLSVVNHTYQNFVVSDHSFFYFFKYMRFMIWYDMIWDDMIFYFIS